MTGPGRRRRDRWRPHPGVACCCPDVYLGGMEGPEEDRYVRQGDVPMKEHTIAMLALLAVTGCDDKAPAPAPPPSPSAAATAAVAEPAQLDLPKVTAAYETDP